MALKDTIKSMRTLLQGISGDIEKAEGGNKAASQRVRTGTIKLEKVAKLYRKESIQAERSGSFKKKTKVVASKKAPAKAKKEKPKAKAKAKPKAKVAVKKKATAKILTKGK